VEQPRGRPAPRQRSETPGLIAAIARISPRQVLDQGLVDRLVRGRVAIALVAFALIGIVTIQLGLLKLNGDIGRALGQASVLQRENAQLGIENSELAAGNRVESSATALGMELVPTGALRFLAADPRRDPDRAVAALSSSIRSSTVSGGEAQGAGSGALGESTQQSAAASATSTSPTGASAPGAAESSQTASTGTAGGEAAAGGTAEPAAGDRESAAGAREPADAGSAATGASASSGTGAPPGEVVATGPGGGTQASSAG
jgi:cell division protein FtsL